MDAVNPFAPLMDEPKWTLISDTKDRYSRPLLGSEVFFAQMAALGDGMAELTMGVVFTTTLSKEVVTERLLESLARFRFTCPLSAAAIVGEDENKLSPSWIYQCAPSYQAVQTWAKNTLNITDVPITSEELMAQLGVKKQPYVHPDGHAQNFSAHLALNLYPPAKGKYALCVHSSHATMDAQAGIDALNLLLQAATFPENGTTASQLEWGTEWKNLPPGPIRAMGGLPENFMADIMPQLQKFGGMIMTPPASHMVKHQRDEITHQAHPVRIHRKLDAATSARLLAHLKSTGFTVAVLFDAAQIVSTFNMNPDFNKETDHVTYDTVPVSLRNYLKTDKDVRTHFVSAGTIIAIKVPASAIPFDAPIRERLLTIMPLIKVQYADWLANKSTFYLMAVRGVLAPMTTLDVPLPNPRAGVMTNLGVIDRIMPVKYQDADGKEVLVVDEVKLGNRMSNVHRPSTHMWSLNGELCFQIQASDNWNEAVLSSFLDEIIRVALSIIE